MSGNDLGLDKDGREEVLVAEGVIERDVAVACKRGKERVSFPSPSFSATRQARLTG